MCVCAVGGWAGGADFGLYQNTAPVFTQNPWVGCIHRHCCVTMEIPSDTPPPTHTHSHTSSVCHSSLSPHIWVHDIPWHFWKQFPSPPSSVLSQRCHDVDPSGWVKHGVPGVRKSCLGGGGARDFMEPPGRIKEEPAEPLVWRGCSLLDQRPLTRRVSPL